MEEICFNFLLDTEPRTKTRRDYADVSKKVTLATRHWHVQHQNKGNSILKQEAS